MQNFKVNKKEKILYIKFKIFYKKKQKNKL